MKQIDRLFNPKQIGLVGIWEQKKLAPQYRQIFERILSNMREFKKFVPIDLSGKRPDCGKSVSEIPKQCDIVGVCLPEPVLEKNIRKIISRTARALVLFTPTMSQKTERELERANKRIWVLGPGSAGLMVPRNKVFLSPYPPLPNGKIVLLTHMGDISGEILKCFKDLKVGISSAFCVGDKPLPETLIQLLGKDEHSNVLALHVHQLRSGRAFFDSLTEIGKEKHVLVFSSNQTSSLFRAAVRQAGGVFISGLPAFASGAKHLDRIPKQERKIVLISNSKTLCLAVLSRVKNLKPAPIAEKALQKMRKKVRELQIHAPGVFILVTLEQKKWRVALDLLAKETDVNLALIIIDTRFAPEDVQKKLIDSITNAKLSSSLCVLTEKELSRPDIFTSLWSFAEGLSALAQR